MPTTASPTLTPAGARPALWVMVLALGAMGMAGSGCCVLDDSCIGITEADGGPDDDRSSPIDVAATEGCPADAITTRGNQRCATCDFGEVCGIPTEAFCETRENSAGARCQLCIADDGDVLYDDCFSGDNDAEVAFCEPQPGRQEGETCNTCFNEVGVAVSTSCTPDADSCTTITRNNRQCEQCTRDGVVVSTTCAADNLDPRRCEAYGDENARCVDCFNDDNALISHACSGGLGFGEAVACEERVQPEGFTCTTCFNAVGVAVDQFCDDGIVQVERCEQLDFSEQTCVVCLDDRAAVAFVDCVRNTCEQSNTSACRVDADCASGQVCFDGQCTTAQSGGEAERPAPDPVSPDCEAPPSCRMSTDAEGRVCRTCPLEEGGTETRCLEASNLVCEVLPEGALPPPPEGDEANAAPPDDPGQGRTCVLCRDRRSDVEVYRDCEGNGAVTPPVCQDILDEDGSTCSVCSDAVSDAFIYSSCGKDSCFDVDDTLLVDRNQAPLTVNGADAVAVCKQCGTGSNDDGSDLIASSLATSCSLAGVCDDEFNNSFARCGGTGRIEFAPSTCQNPWETHRQGTGRRADIRGMMAWALDVHRLTVQAVTSTPSPGATPCAANDCSCARGDVLELVVDVADVERAQGIFSAR